MAIDESKLYKASEIYKDL